MKLENLVLSALTIVLAEATLESSKANPPGLWIRPASSFTIPANAPPIPSDRAVPHQLTC